METFQSALAGLHSWAAEREEANGDLCSCSGCHPGCASLAGHLWASLEGIMGWFGLILGSLGSGCHSLGAVQPSWSSSLLFLAPDFTWQHPQLTPMPFFPWLALPPLLGGDPGGLAMLLSSPGMA